MPNTHRRRDETALSRRRRRCVLGIRLLIWYLIFRIHGDFADSRRWLLVWSGCGLPVDSMLCELGWWPRCSRCDCRSRSISCRPRRGWWRPLLAWTACRSGRTALSGLLIMGSADPLMALACLCCAHPSAHNIHGRWSPVDTYYSIFCYCFQFVAFHCNVCRPYTSHECYPIILCMASLLDLPSVIPNTTNSRLVRLPFDKYMPNMFRLVSTIILVVSIRFLTSTFDIFCCQRMCRKHFISYVSDLTLSFFLRIHASSTRTHMIWWSFVFWLTRSLFPICLKCAITVTACSVFLPISLL